MARFFTRVLGLLLLTLTITVPGCQAVMRSADTANAPQQLSPGSFSNGR
jgi:hypothetical protein